MTENERRFTAPQHCPHCGVEASMEIIGSHTRLKRDVHERESRELNRCSTVYQLISCPVCEEVTLRSDSGLVPKHQCQQGIQTKPLESTKQRHAMVPDPFKTAYAATYAFRKLDPVAYAAMLGHLTTIRECNRYKRI